MRVTLCWVGITKELQCFVDEQFRGGLSALAGPLAIEAPVEIPLDARPAFGRKASLHPVEHQRCLTGPAPSQQCVDIYGSLGPSIIECRQLLLASEEDLGCMLPQLSAGDLPRFL